MSRQLIRNNFPNGRVVERVQRQQTTCFKREYVEYLENLVLSSGIIPNVVVTSCPECGSNDLDYFEHVVSCNNATCNWYAGKD